MKKLIMTAIAAFASLAVTGVDAMTLAEAGAKKAEAAADPNAMAAVIKDLSEADQVQFLAMVNAEIEALPLSAEEKTAKYLDAATAAIASCPASNRAALMAETFATVPLASLTAINEKFAEDFKKGASQGDVAGAAIATMKTIESRTATAPDSDRRNTFAVLTFVRAAGGETATELREALLEGYPSEASLSWVPSAMGEVTGTKDYAPLLGGGATTPNLEEVYSMLLPAPAVLSGAMLADLAGTGNSFANAVFDPDQFTLPGGSMDFGIDLRIPRTTDKSKPWHNTGKRGESPYEEPDVYPGQSLD